jgi:hypothetical protein
LNDDSLDVMPVGDSISVENSESVNGQPIGVLTDQEVGNIDLLDRLNNLEADNLVVPHKIEIESREDYAVKMAAELTMKGFDGKDCLLLAAISGHSDVLDFAYTVIQDAFAYKEALSKALEAEREAEMEALALQALELSALQDIAGLELTDSVDGSLGLSNTNLADNVLNDEVTDNIVITAPNKSGKDGVVVIDSSAEGSDAIKEDLRWVFSIDEKVEGFYSTEGGELASYLVTYFPLSFPTHLPSYLFPSNYRSRGANPNSTLTLTLSLTPTQTLTLTLILTLILTLDWEDGGEQILTLP